MKRKEVKEVFDLSKVDQYIQDVYALECQIEDLKKKTIQELCRQIFLSDIENYQRVSILAKNFLPCEEVEKALAERYALFFPENN